jgi:hypothetical protein
VGLAVGSLLVWGSQGFPTLPQSLSRTPLAILPSQLLAVVCVVVGALLCQRAPSNPIGWLLLAGGLAMATILPAALLVAEAHQAFRPASGLTRLAAWAVSSLSTSVVVGCLALATLLFPDGRLSSRPLRVAAILSVVAALALAAVLAFDPVGLVWYPTIANPFAAPPSAAPIFGVARLPAAALMVAAMAAIALSLTWRYRSGDAVTRAQLRWIVYAMSFTALSVVAFVVARHILTVGDALGEWVVATTNLSTTTVPVAAALAITRYHLFGIDRLINRTLVYVPLLGVLGGLYAAAVALFQRVFVAVTGETSDAPMLMAVFVIAAAFTPVRKAMEGFVDRWANGGSAGAVDGAEAEVPPPAADGAAVSEPAGRETWGADPEMQRVAAAILSLRRFEERLVRASPSTDTSGRVVQLPVGADGRVACPRVGRMPLSGCLGCPDLRAIVTVPAEVHCGEAPTAAST